LARTVVANQLAVMVIGYRVGHELTRTCLARLLRVSQPAAARLESGDHESSLTTVPGCRSSWGSPCAWSCRRG
jgi:predicted transcriptional regulator